MRASRGILLLVVAALAATGCGGTSPAKPELLVGAASSLEPVLTEMEGVLEFQLGVDLTFSYGASGSLAAQIRQGAPMDVFISADPTFTTDLANDGLLNPASLRAFAEGRLVAVSTFAPDAWRTAATVALDPRVSHVAIANPEIAPYGAAAEDFLREAGVWEGVEPKVVYAGNVAQAFQFVATGNAEVGYVPLTLFLAAAPSDDLHLVEGLPASAHQPLTQTAGVVADGDEPFLSGQLTAALLDPVIQVALDRFGYAPAPEVAP